MFHLQLSPATQGTNNTKTIIRSSKETWKFQSICSTKIVKTKKEKKIYEDKKKKQVVSI